MAARFSSYRQTCLSPTMVLKSDCILESLGKLFKKVMSVSFAYLEDSDLIGLGGV